MLAEFTVPLGDVFAMRKTSPFTNLLIFAIPLAVSACTSSNVAPFPTYQYLGIDLLAQIEGTVRRDADCLRMQTASPPDQDIVLILPDGTRFEGETIALPSRNGGKIVTLGMPVAVQGGFDTLDGVGRHIRNPTACSGPAFVVNRIVPSAR